MAKDSRVISAFQDEDAVEETATVMKNAWSRLTLSKTGNFRADGIQASGRFDSCVVLTNGQQPEDGDYFLEWLSGEQAKGRISSGRFQETAQ